jgi:hypothetical protein
MSSLEIIKFEDKNYLYWKLNLNFVSLFHTQEPLSHSPSSSFVPFTRSQNYTSDISEDHNRINVKPTIPIMNEKCVAYSLVNFLGTTLSKIKTLKKPNFYMRALRRFQLCTTKS